MANNDLNIVTGAFGFSGKHITRMLLEMGKSVKTITGHPRRSEEFGDKVEAMSFNFDKPDELTKSLQGASTLYNTYWIRFAHGDETFDKAVENSRTLIKAAKDAGIKKIVHVSITNPSEDSDLPYFRGKALVEEAIHESGLSYAILRPAVLFGDQGILINNIAWFLRRMPAFAVPGNGDYGIQPIHVDDLAELAVTAGQEEDNKTIDAVGPEKYTFQEMVLRIRQAIGSRTSIIHASPTMAYYAATLFGYLVGDVVLTRDEVKGLMDNLLVSDEPPTGHTKLSEWLDANAGWLGSSYFSEVKKHFE